jgi:DNA polymerase-1
MEWKSIWAVDFEYAAAEGDNPRPLCVVAHDLQSGRRLRQWLDGVSAAECPYDTDAESLFLAYYASAEIGCHLELGGRSPHESSTCARNSNARPAASTCHTAEDSPPR